MTSPTWQRPGYAFDPAEVQSLPNTAYASPEVFEREMQRAFSPENGLKYVGHDILLPLGGHRRSDGDERLVLTRDADGAVHLLANLCTHACRPILSHDEPINKPRLACEFHD
ncbi:MAG: Rieske 2Fe-2S domain-containing protein, partial [Actinobacteria bacterium]|nr:Rieske 2Fe-2S domain-containing protein [Actinomycetota bacterium]